MFGNVCRMFRSVRVMVGIGRRLLGSVLKLFGNVRALVGKVHVRAGNVLNMFKNVSEIFGKVRGIIPGTRCHITADLLRFPIDYEVTPVKNCTTAL